MAGRIDVLKWLLLTPSAGRMINARDELGFSPLHRTITTLNFMFGTGADRDAAIETTARWLIFHG